MENLKPNFHTSNQAIIFSMIDHNADMDELETIVGTKMPQFNQAIESITTRVYRDLTGNRMISDQFDSIKNSNISSDVQVKWLNEILDTNLARDITVQSIRGTLE